MKDVFQFETYDIDINDKLLQNRLFYLGYTTGGDGLWMRVRKEDCEGHGIEIIVEPQPWIDYA